ncbi:hypothetical protein SAMN05216238_106227 [Lentibacillus persicus]|uniref:Uncharacterized protein n=1 Tax=Lentibacillus persicus TaxID=640948 RepID=A0A1I1WPV7_9BACI|nr:hypothetical protein [Lentibacillus persicus]SFD97207.1 hypothetical protein SAMN05216238_106227 [Lentibacillus persicus]
MEFFIEHYAMVFVAAIATTGLTIMLRAFWVTLVQAVLIALPVFITAQALIPFFLTLQLILTALTLYKFLKAIDMNYQLVLEKTHEKDPKLIKDEHRGSRFSFWKIN